MSALREEQRGLAADQSAAEQGDVFADLVHIGIDVQRVQNSGVLQSGDGQHQRR